MFFPARCVYWRDKQQGQKLQLTRTSSKQHIVVAVSVHLLLLYGASCIVSADVSATVPLVLPGQKELLLERKRWLLMAVR